MPQKPQDQGFVTAARPLLAIGSRSSPHIIPNFPKSRKDSQNLHLHRTQSPNPQTATFSRTPEPHLYVSRRSFQNYPPRDSPSYVAGFP
uniref:Uncharacterized protein n=1 Tax=uncultured marine virus TaxID=186617 RepID=A0A0F7L5A8_9VIRU|nr:hypothetical protein [uncultured marine virus]